MQPMKDPAPSRLAYRIERWMLTPGVKLGLRIGVPLAVVFGAVTLWLNDPVRRDTITQFASDLRASIEERPEFMVNLMAIDGASVELAEEIRLFVPLDFPTSSFDLDLEDIRGKLIDLPPVQTAAVRIRPGGILQVDVTEREPAMLWRARDGLKVVDAAGVVVSSVPNRKMRPDLPLIAGDGANDVVIEARALFSAAAPLRDRLRGLVRVGERRWDVVLDRDQRILLPEDKPVRALERVIAFSAAQKMLERDVRVVDMRLENRPTLRMSKAATQEWWITREINQKSAE